MESKHIALIRGINVGRAKRVAMKDLRALFEDLGYREVRTLLNSGNVIFSAQGTCLDNSVGCIEEALSSKIGVSARVLVFTAEELAAVVNENPLVEVAADHSRLLVAFLENPADLTRLKPLEEQSWGQEVLALGTRAVYLWCADGVLVSGLPKAVGKLLGDSVTTRNWATVLKLYAITKKEV